MPTTVLSFSNPPTPGECLAAQLFYGYDICAGFAKPVVSGGSPPPAPAVYSADRPLGSSAAQARSGGGSGCGSCGCGGGGASGGVAGTVAQIATALEGPGPAGLAWWVWVLIVLVVLNLLRS